MHNVVICYAQSTTVYHPATTAHLLIMNTI